MPDQFSFMDFPEKGIDLQLPNSRRTPDTTDTAVNVRLYEALTHRARGGSRSGLSRYLPTALPGAIQELNTVVHIEETATGGANFQEGDTTWTTISYSGTYVLGLNVTSASDLLLSDDTNFLLSDNTDFLLSDANVGPWKLSAVLNVDANGNWHEGPITGTPVGGDFSQLAITPFALPTDYFVVAYWQPGAFPWDGSAPFGVYYLGGRSIPFPPPGPAPTPPPDYQESDLFPGFGWMRANFPTGTVANDFGYPAATTPGFTVSSSSGVPAIPFWNWPSGYTNEGLRTVFP